MPGTVRHLLGACVLLLFAAAPPARAQGVRAALSADSVTVGERFHLSVVVEHPATAVPRFPDPSAVDSAGALLRFGDLEVLSRSAHRYTSARGMPVDSVVYEVTTFALDTAFVPPIAVGFQADRDTFSVATPALMVPVVSLVPPDAGGVRDLAPLVDFPEPIWPWILLAISAAVLLGMLLYYLHRRRRRPAEAPPAPAPRDVSAYEAAVARLDRLAEEDLRNLARVKPFYVEVADVLRTYLARRLGVAAMESTTRELLRDVAAHPSVAPNPLRRLRSMLELADLVKFAEAHPPAETGLQVLSNARTTLQEIEDAVRPTVEPEAAPRTAPAEAPVA